MSQKGVNYYYQEQIEQSLCTEESVVYKNTSFIERKQKPKELGGWNSSLLREYPVARSSSKPREGVAKVVMAVPPVRRGARTPPLQMPVECKLTASGKDSKGLCSETEIVVDDTLVAQAVYFHELMQKGATEECLKERFGASFAILMDFVRANSSSKSIELVKSSEKETQDKGVVENSPEIITIEDSDSDSYDVEIIECVQGTKDTAVSNIEELVPPAKLKPISMEKCEINMKNLAVLSSDVVQHKKSPELVVLKVYPAPAPAAELLETKINPEKEPEIPVVKENTGKSSKVSLEATVTKDLCNTDLQQSTSSDIETRKSKKTKKTKRKRRQHKSSEREKTKRSKNLEDSVSHEWYENIFHSKWNRNKPKYFCSLSEANEQFRNCPCSDKAGADREWAMDSFIELLTDLDLGTGCAPSTSTAPCPAFTGAILFDRESTIPWSSKKERSYPEPHPYEEWASRMRMRRARYLETGIDFLGLAGRASSQWTTDVDLSRETPMEVSVTIGNIKYFICSFATTTTICFSVSITAPDDTDKWAESVCLQVNYGTEMMELNATLHSGRLTASMPAEDGISSKLEGGRVRLTLTVSSIQFSFPAPSEPTEHQIPFSTDPLMILHYHSSFLYFTCPSFADFTRQYGRDVQLLGSVLKKTGTDINEHNVAALLSFADALRFETLQFACEQFLIKSNRSPRTKRILADGYMLPNLELSLQRLPKAYSISSDSPQSAGKVPPLRIYREENDEKSWRIRHTDDSSE